MPFFQIPTSPPGSIAENTVDVWRLSLDKNYPVDQFLTADERDRAARFHFKCHARRFRQAHGQLRLLLGLYLQQNPLQIPFVYNKHGKPSIANSNLCFNLSHSGEMALVALGKNMDLGVDIEQYTARPYLGIATHVFSSQEMAELKSSPVSLRAHVFFNFWTQKEAFIKACGLGLHYPTRTFTVLCHEPGGYIVRDPLHALDRSLISFYSQAGFPSALCYPPECSQINFNCFDPVPYFGSINSQG